MSRNSQFIADLKAHRDLTRDKMRRVFQQSVQDVMITAEEGTPVDTGFLRASLASELNGAQLAEGEGSYTVAIAGAELGDNLRFAWDTTRRGAFTANYAVFVEFGTSRMSGRHFVGRAAAQWPQFVEANARAVR